MTEAFEINEITGLIKTSLILDREFKDTYNIILEVSDNGSPKQSVTRILQVKVLDVDDHKSVFRREVDEAPLEFKLWEEQQEGTIMGNFSAIDEDIDDNAAIDYVITEGNEDNVFNVERTEDNMAIIKTTKPVDREVVDSYALAIKCLKFGEPKYPYLGDAYDHQDLSNIRVNIPIMDIDDNLPQFEYHGIHINVPIGSKITTIRATDSDASNIISLLMTII